MAISPVLVLTPAGSACRPAIERAVSWAGEYGCSLVLAGARRPEGAVLSAAADVPWEFVALDRERPGDVLRLAEACRPRMVVMVAPDGDRLETVAALIREIACPVWLVRPGPRRGTCVLAGVDPFDEQDGTAAADRAVLRATLELAEALVLPPVVVHAAPVEAIPGRRPRLVALAGDFGLAAGSVFTYAGSPAAAVDAAVREHRAAVTVLGAQKRSLAHRLALGSTLQQLLGRLSADVMAVKPDWILSLATS